MNNTWNRNVLLVEAVLIGAPLTLLLLWFGPAAIVHGASAWTTKHLRDTAPYEMWPDITIAVLTTLSIIATLAGWRLIFSYLRHGISGLRSVHWAWWVGAFIGVLVAASALASKMLAPAPEFSQLASFRSKLALLSLGTPLIIILGHLAILRMRPSANAAMHATCEDACV